MASHFAVDEHPFAAYFMLIRGFQGFDPQPYNYCPQLYVGKGGLHALPPVCGFQSRHSRNGCLSWTLIWLECLTPRWHDDFLTLGILANHVVLYSQNNENQKASIFLKQADVPRRVRMTQLLFFANRTQVRRRSSIHAGHRPVRGGLDYKRGHQDSSLRTLKNNSVTCVTCQADLSEAATI